MAIEPQDPSKLGELTDDERELLQHVRDKHFFRANRIMERIIGEPNPGGAAPYEDCIAYIMGNLALGGYLPADFAEKVLSVSTMRSTPCPSGSWRGWRRTPCRAKPFLTWLTSLKQASCSTRRWAQNDHA